MKQIKILVVDDHEVVQKGILKILEEREDFYVVGRVSNGQEALDFVGREQVDLVIMDISMPVMNGKEASRRLRKEYPGLKILVLTTFNHKRLINEVKSIGVNGYLLKDRSGQLLIDAIDRIREEDKYFEEGEPAVDKELPYLGMKETEVLQLYCTSLGPKEISERMGISHLTAKTHIKNIRKKFGLESNSEIIDFAVENGMV